MSLSGNILATVSYFDALDHPLSSFEVWKHLTVPDDGNPDPVRLGEVVSALDGEDLRGKLSFRDGFYSLPGREGLVPKRIRLEKVSAAKLSRLRRLASLLSFVPFVRMIGITGSLGMRRGDVSSDWDFFVVLKAGRIWTGRTLLTVFLHGIGKRRHGRFEKDRACLNYFVTDDNLTVSTEDLYSANEYRHMIPVLGEETFRSFEPRNRWIARFRPNFLPTEPLPLWYVPDSAAAASVRRFLERMLDSDALEAWLGGWQRKKIMRNPKTRIDGGYIEASDKELIFLPHPHGPEIYEKFRQRFGESRLGR
jgi:hypothetical protein